MCLLITLVAALISIILWLIKKLYFRKNDRCMFAVSAMLWSATLMWCAMGAISAITGGNFLEMTKKDAALGIIVVVCSVAMYFFLLKKNVNGAEKADNE